MRVHVLLCTFLALSSLTWAVPHHEETVEGRGPQETVEGRGPHETVEGEVEQETVEGRGPQEDVEGRGPQEDVEGLEQQDTEAVANEMYDKHHAGIASGNVQNQPGPANGNGNVFVAVSKWTLEKLYSFINSLYEKLKQAMDKNGRNTQLYGVQGKNRITNDDLRSLYSVLYVLYNIIQQNADTTFPGEKPVDRPHQQPENFNTGSYAIASSKASSKASTTRKRSYGSQPSDLDEEIFDQVAMDTVRTILKKLGSLHREKQDAKAKPVLEEVAKVQTSVHAPTLVVPQVVIAHEQTKTQAVV